MIARGERRWLLTPLLLAVCLLCLAALFAFEPWKRTGSPTPKAVWTDYGWDELSAIADEISACDADDKALSSAARYGLCGVDGSIDPALSKDVELLGGENAKAMLLDVWHDKRTDGAKAGLTFALCVPSETLAMNLSFDDGEGDHAQSVGGWAASEARAHLADELWYELPPDLRTHVVSVQKPTANTVGTGDELAEAGLLAGTAADWVSETTDALWLLSVSELCGEVPPNEDLGVDETMCSVYAGEGARYRLFTDAGVTAFEPSELLARLGAGVDGEARTWWLRTKTLEFGDGFWLVGTDGTTLNGLGEDVRVVEDPEYAPDELWGPDHPRGVVVGFCL